MDVNGTERVNFNALGGADQITVNDLTGTGVTEVNLNLTGGGGKSVVVNGTAHDDAIAVSGVIWGLWHVPLIVTGLYAAGPNPLLSAAIFIVMVVAITFPISWARLATGSIWPAARSGV